MGQLCACVSRERGEAVAGTAVCFERYIAVELPTPWPADIADAASLGAALRTTYAGIQAGGGSTRLLAVAPDPIYSSEGLRRLMLFTRPAAPFDRFERRELLVPPRELSEVAATMLLTPNDPALAAYTVDSCASRDLFVCTHGSHDSACGAFGYPLYRELRELASGGHQAHVRIWRSSHLGGHRFAPTMLDLPEGRYWGRLESAVLPAIIRREGELGAAQHYNRGWSGGERLVQIAEDAIFAREGWAWAACHRSGKIVAVDDGPVPTDVDERDPARAKVEVTFITPAGDNGSYLALIERVADVETLGESGDGPTQVVAQYCLRELDRIR